MSTTTVYQPLIICDLDAEKPSGLPDGIRVYCKDTQKYYAVFGGVFIGLNGTGGPGGASWGSITGTLSSQSDLNTALTGKVATNDSRLSDARTPLTHSHAPGDVTGTAVVTADSRLSDARTPTAHSHTKAEAGLGNCDNTSDVNKSVSTATQTALDLKADKTLLGQYRTLMTSMGSHIAGKVAGKYMIGCGDPLAVSGTGTLFPVALIPLYTADYPTINGLATKLRLQAIVTVNNVAPTGNFTVGLYPVTSGAGGAGLKIFTAGTLVTGSGCTQVTTPAGSSITRVVSADFAFPADGLYVLAVVTTATVATSSLVQIWAQLQIHNA